MNGPPAVLAVSVPDELYGDIDHDPYCIEAGMHVSKRLGDHLRHAGHEIPAWLGDGCEEDAWVHLESRFDKRHYVYTIVFFPRGDEGGSMAIQFARKLPIIQRLLGKSDEVEASNPLQEVLLKFGRTFARSDVLSREQFDLLY